MSSIWFDLRAILSHVKYTVRKEKIMELKKFK